MKKIVYLTGTRAEFGLMRLILQAIQQNNNLELILLATGMHLMDEFGKTISEVKKEFQVKVIEAVYEKDNRESMARFVAKCCQKIVEVLIESKPNVVLILGDRGEQLAMATAAAYLNIPVIHLHGGEETTTVDDKTRKAIAALADWHLPATKKAKKKLLKAGVDKKTIEVVGAPGLDEAYSIKLANKRDLIVVLQHPDENENKAKKQIENTLKAVINFKLPVKVIYPNADAGGRVMIKTIEAYAHRYPKIIKTFRSLERKKFLHILSQARVLVGNSSAGLIESPALELPAVNVGSRQKGRERAKNVIDVGYRTHAIEKAIRKALGMKLKTLKNPHGDGQTTERVIKFLETI
jgi:GDP/UDP-N,N'-diacetylbacillosamine 2-epimerase (hydrolysing)